jgi:hypothetical protein
MTKREMYQREGILDETWLKITNKHYKLMANWEADHTENGSLL